MLLAAPRPPFTRLVYHSKQHNLHVELLVPIPCEQTATPSSGSFRSHRHHVGLGFTAHDHRNHEPVLKHKTPINKLTARINIKPGEPQYKAELSQTPHKPRPLMMILVFGNLSPRKGFKGSTLLRV